MSKSSTVLHLMNFSILLLGPRILNKIHRIFMYQYAFKNIRAPLVSHRVYALATISSIIEKIIIITPSPRVYELCKKIRGNCIYVPPPIETKLDSKEILRGKEDDVINITYIGHANYYRFPYNQIFKAIKKLNERHRQKIIVRIYLSKQGYTEYNTFSIKLREYIDKLNLNKIFLIVKNLNESEKESVLSNTDIFLFPALYPVATDPPLTVLEAMSFGNIVLSTDVQSLPYILSNNRGIIISKNNLEYNIYQALQELFYNYKHLNLIKFRAYQYIRNIHNMKSIIRYFRKYIL